MTKRCQDMVIPAISEVQDLKYPVVWSDCYSAINSAFPYIAAGEIAYTQSYPSMERRRVGICLFQAAFGSRTNMCF